MTDTITVRNHDEPCEHGMKMSHYLPVCPGGREITLQQAYGKWEPENVKSLKIWIEATNE